MNKVKAQDILTDDQIAIVRKRSDLRAIWIAAHAWGTCFAAMALFVYFPNPLTFTLAFVVIGSRQLGLAILMHDAAHGVLAKSPKLNEFIGQWLGAYPLMAETWSYRRYHLQHHNNTQQAEDPDLILSAPFPITKKSFRRKMWRDITGQTGYQQRKAQILSALGSSDMPLGARLKRYWSKLGRATLTHVILFAGLAATGHWYLYFVLWLLPFLTWHQVITRIRNIAEHAMVPDSNDVFRSSRTTVLSLWERAFFGPYWVNYHVEHHLMMWIPCYNLPKAQEFLKANGHWDRMETKNGYWEVIKMATSKPDDQDKPGEVIHNTRRRVAGITSEGFEAAN
jgi:fatty acid desaturase